MIIVKVYFSIIGFLLLTILIVCIAVLSLEHYEKRKELPGK